MYVFLSILVILLACITVIIIFMNDKKHDLEICIGIFKLSIKKHRKE